MLRDTSALAAVTSTSSPAPPVLAGRLNYITPAWWADADDLEKRRRYSTIKYVVKRFVTGTFRGTVLDTGCAGRHIYSVRKGGTELWLFKDNPTTKIKFCVAKLVNGAFVGNSSSLSWTTMNGKLYNLNGREERIQGILSDVMPMLPFAMLKENGFDLDKLTVLDRGAEERLAIARGGKVAEQHFTGSMLFKIAAKKTGDSQLQFFLFDVDRGDLDQKVFNPFLSRISKPCSTIAEAYDSLKPKEVRDAERFLKKPCIRQGEWFFIPVVGEFEKAKAGTRYSTFDQERFKKFNAKLQSKGNRAHYARHISTCERYVTGTVAHGGFEHPDLELEGWHKAVPNTAIESFTIVGGID